jgi:hypothetical protein
MRIVVKIAPQLAESGGCRNSGSSAQHWQRPRRQWASPAVVGRSGPWRALPTLSTWRSSMADCRQTGFALAVGLGGGRHCRVHWLKWSRRPKTPSLSHWLECRPSTVGPVRCGAGRCRLVAAGMRGRPKHASLGCRQRDCWPRGRHCRAAGSTDGAGPTLAGCWTRNWSWLPWS